MKIEKTKYLKLGVVISFILIIIGMFASFLISFTSLEKSNIKFAVILELLGLLLFLLFGQAYGKRTIDKTDERFWIPRTFGWGVSINPHNKAAKITTYLLSFLIALLIILLIFIPINFYS